MIYFLLSRSKFGWAYVFIYSQKYSTFIVRASPPQILLLFFFTVSCCNIPFGRSFIEYFFTDSKNFLPGICILSSDVKIKDNDPLLVCWEGRGCKGICSPRTLGKLTHFTCGVRHSVCPNSSALLARTRRRHWNSGQAFWKLSVFSDPFPHTQSQQISQGTLRRWYKSQYECQFCP